MQEKNNNAKKYIDFLKSNQHVKRVVNSKIPLKFYLGGVPRKKLIVPQNFWVNSPRSFFGKIILLLVSLFLGLIFFTIFFAVLFRTILN